MYTNALMIFLSNLSALILDGSFPFSYSVFSGVPNVDLCLLGESARGLYANFRIFKIANDHHHWGYSHRED